MKRARDQFRLQGSNSSCFSLGAFQFARQERQIRKNLVAKDAATSGSRVRPANATFLFAVRRRLTGRFEVVNMREELPALARGQCLHLLQNFIRTHLTNYTT